MRILHFCLLACLWLLQVGALEFWKDPNYSEPTGEPLLNASYEDFRKKHIDPKMTANKCDSEMKRRNIYGPKNSCKETNTFILAPAEKVKSICRGQKKNDMTSKMTKSTVKFRIVVCKLKNNVKVPRCEYRGKLLTDRAVVVSCQGGLPVHYERHE